MWKDDRPRHRGSPRARIDVFAQEKDTLFLSFTIFQNQLATTYPRSETKWRHKDGPAASNPSTPSRPNLSDRIAVSKRSRNALSGIVFAFCCRFPPPFNTGDQGAPAIALFATVKELSDALKKGKHPEMEEQTKVDIGHWLRDNGESTDTGEV